MSADQEATNAVVPPGEATGGMLASFARGDIPFSILYATLEADVCDAARYGAAQVSNHYTVDPDDVAQELWMMMPTIASRYEAPRPAGPYITGYAKKIALSLAHARGNMATLTDVVFEDEDHADALDRLCGGGDGGIPDIDPALDRRRALDVVVRKLQDAGELDMERTAKTERIGKKMTQHQVVPFTVAGTEPLLRRPLPREEAASREPAKRKLTDDQEMLILWRQELSMTQQEFAASLGIGVPRLVSYEHGKTAAVPPEIMTSARSLWLSLRDGAAIRRGRYVGKTMADIFYEWVAKFAITRADYDSREYRTKFQRENGVGVDVFLADMLGTTVPTITRWRDNKTMPAVDDLVRHEKMAEIGGKRFIRQQACVSRIQEAPARAKAKSKAPTKLSKK